MRLQEGDPAPDFTLPADTDTSFTLSEHLGKKVVLYFYPKDDTPGCTTEAKNFTDYATAFQSCNAIVVGMSPDTVKKHDKFKAKHELDVILVADENQAVLTEYGVWVEKKMYGKTYMGIERTTLVIDEKGTISKIWPKVKVKGHVQDVLNFVKSL